MDTTEMIPPALSPDEWAKRLCGQKDLFRPREGVPFIGSTDDWLDWENGDAEEAERPSVQTGLRITYDSAVVSQEIPDEERHAIAALALYGKRYGFTRADVLDARSEGLDDLATRIEALLPPTCPETENSAG